MLSANGIVLATFPVTDHAGRRAGSASAGVLPSFLCVHTKIESKTEDCCSMFFFPMPMYHEIDRKSVV